MNDITKRYLILVCFLIAMTGVLQFFKPSTNKYLIGVGVTFILFYAIIYATSKILGTEMREKTIIETVVNPIYNTQRDKATLVNETAPVKVPLYARPKRKGPVKVSGYVKKIKGKPVKVSKHTRGKPKW